MDDQAPPTNNGAEPTDNPTPVDIAKEPSPEPTQPATEQQLREVEREMTGFERATLRWARVAVIMSGLAALFVCLQWWEMHQGGIDTHALAESTGDMANAASDQADAAQQFSDTAEDINNRMSDAVDKLQAAAENAKASIKATQDALRLEQRAWVFVSAMELKPLVLNDPFTIQFFVKNEGRTPATIRKETRIFMRVGDKVDKLQSIPGNPLFRLGLVFPGIVYGPDVASSTDNGGTRVIGPNDVAAYAAKPPAFWVYFY